MRNVDTICRTIGAVKYAVSAGLICASLLGTSAVRADEQRTAPFEATVFAGYRMGGGFELIESAGKADLDDHGAFAMALNLRRDETSQYELFYGRQSTRLDSTFGTPAMRVEYLHLGGTLVVNEELWIKPYVIGTIGGTRFTPGTAGVGNDSRFSFSLGGGMRLPLTERFSLRLEARGWLTLINTESALFCRSDDGGAICRIRGKGDTFIQYELLAGVAFAF
jgi:opacity protein-like surface antigen